MSDILLDWLNNEIKLSVKVTDIANDFSNGYLIAEILHRFHQIPNFSDYRNTQQRKDMIHNFGLLEKALSDLDIRHTETNTEEIMAQNKRTAAMLLYSIKTKLARKQINFDTLMNKIGISNLHRIYQSTKYPNMNQKYIIYANNRNGNPEAVQAQNQRALVPVKYHKLDITPYETKIIKDIQHEEELFKEDKIEMDKKIRQQETSRHGGTVDKDIDEAEKWTHVMDRKNQFVNKKQEDAMKDTIFYRTAELNLFKHSSKVNEVLIDTFDKNLSKLGLDLNMIDPKLKKQAKVMNSDMLFLKMKEKLEQNLESKKERDRRKRKISVEQAKTHSEGFSRNVNLNLLHEDHPTVSMHPLPSSREKRFHYETVRNLHNRNIKFEEQKKKNEQATQDMPKQIEYDYYCKTQFVPELFFRDLHRENLQVRLREMSKRAKKKERDTALLSDVMNLIFDLCDESYNYQQEHSTDLVELSEWRSWMQKFIDGKSVTKDICYFEAEGEDSSKGNEVNITHPQISFHDKSEDITSGALATDYEDSEFLDYVYLIGQWNKNIIPKNVLGMQLKFVDVLGKDFAQFAGLDKGEQYNTRGSKQEQFFEPKEDDIDNISIPKGHVKNPTLSEVLEIIFDLKYPQECAAITTACSPWFYLPIKIAFIGHRFSGRKSQARGLCEQYPGIKVYVIDEILKKSIETYERLEVPVEAHPKFKTMKKAQIEQLQHEKAAEEEKFKNIKGIIQSYAMVAIINKQNPPVPDDEMLVNLLLEFLKTDFPEKSPSQYTEEIMTKYKRKKEIGEELAKIKEEQIKKPKAKLKEEQQLNSELNKLLSEVYKGFILVDFPRNETQARLFEYKLAGYIQEIEKPQLQNVAIKENLSVFIDNPTAKASQSKILKSSGLDMIVNIDVPLKECVRRLVGRRIDPNTGNVYHLEDNPPPANDHKLNDRLQVIPEPSESRLYQDNYEYDFTFRRLIDFYDNLGIQRYSTKALLSINGLKAKNLLRGDIQNIVIAKLLKANEDKEFDIVANSTNYTRLNVSDNMHTVISTPGPQQVADRNSNFISDAIDSRDLPEDDELSKYNRKLNEYKKKISISTYESIYHVWSKLYDTYSTECKIIFKTLKKQKESIVQCMNRVQAKFIEFLSRPSKKKNVIAVYVNKYNSLAERYPELKECRQVKDEFHKDLTELTDRIWEIIDMRKCEAIEERRKVMTSQWIESEMEKFYIQLEKLFINETEKFITSMAMIKEFYQALDSRAGESWFNSSRAVINPMDILNEVESLKLEQEKAEMNGISVLSFPKIEKLYLNCFKIIFKNEEKLKPSGEYFKRETSNDSLYIKKRKPGYHTYGTKVNDSIIIEDKKDIQLYEEELKSSVKIEKWKYKYRVTLLKFWGIKALTEMRNIAGYVYHSMDQWIIDSIKAQNEAMNNTIEYFRSLVEKERKARLDMDMEMDCFDIYTIKDVSTLLEQPPQGNMSIEGEMSRYNIQKFAEIIDEIRSCEIQKYLIKPQTFLEVYFIKHLIDKSSSAIPDSVKMLSFHNFRNFLKYFQFNVARDIKIFLGDKETQFQELINLKHISTVLALVNCTVMDRSHEEFIKSKVVELEYLRNSTLISKENFMNLKFWFESDRSIPITCDDENENLEKISFLKEMIFEFNKDDNNEVFFPELMNIFSLRILPFEPDRTIGKTYYELLFF